MFQKVVFLVLLVLGAIAYQAQGNPCMVHETICFRVSSIDRKICS